MAEELVVALELVELDSDNGVVLGQAVLFGVSHGYQGMKSVITITVCGAWFGLLALWCRGAGPGVIAHAWTDIFSGLLSGRG
jgi:CAAX protease family protein